MENSDTPSKSFGVVSIVDRAWEIVWAARAVSICLFIDIALILSTNSSLVSWAVTGKAPTVNAAWIILAVGTFCLCAGFLFPAILWLLKLVVISAPSLPKGPTDYFQMPHGYVWQSRALEEALRTENQFQLDWHKENERRSNKREEDSVLLADLLATVSVLALINGLLGYLSDSLASAFELLLSWSGQAGILCFGMAGLAIANFVVQVWRSWSKKIMFHPKLAEKIEADRPELRSIE